MNAMEALVENIHLFFTSSPHSGGVIRYRRLRSLEGGIPPFGPGMHQVLRQEFRNL